LADLQKDNTIKIISCNTIHNSGFTPRQQLQTVFLSATTGMNLTHKQALAPAVKTMMSATKAEFG
jgi:hypothetical protein